MARSSEFELLGRTTIGQYMPTGSVLHRIDPRVKLCMLLMLISAAIVTRSLIGLAVLLAAVILGLSLAHIPLRFAASSLIQLLPFLVLLALLQILFIHPATSRSSVLWRWHSVAVTAAGLMAGVQLVGRFAVLVLGISLFSVATSTTELTHGIEHLLSPLQRFGLPAHEFALVVLIAIRFVPILAREAERLMKAQASRGASFSSGGGLVGRARRILPLLIPLFLLSLRRADALVEAMEARCYMGGKGRSHLISLRAQLTDYVALVVCMAVSLLAIALGPAQADASLWSLLALRK